MIELYGITQSRTFRPRWLLEELELPYVQHPLDFRGDDLKRPDYLRLNPNGRVPTLVDDGLVLWESMAINLYLAEKYGQAKGLWPQTIEERARMQQWTFWVVTEIETPLLTVLMHKRVLPEEQRDTQRATRNEGILKRPLRILNDRLADCEYLATDGFSVADLNVAAVLSWAKPARVPTKPYEHLDAWLTRCLARPACKRAQRDAT